MGKRAGLPVITYLLGVATVLCIGAAFDGPQPHGELKVVYPRLRNGIWDTDFGAGGREKFTGIHVAHFYKSERIRWVRQYENGVQTGPILSFHENGRLRTWGTLEQGKRKGLYYFFSDDGTLRLKQEFSENDQLENVWALRKGRFVQTMANGTGLNILFDEHGNEGGWEEVREHRKVRGAH